MKVHGFNPSEQEITVMIENVDKGRVQNTKKKYDICHTSLKGGGGQRLNVILFNQFF